MTSARDHRAIAAQSALASACHAVVGVLLAPTCAACDSLLDAPLDGPVCARCWNAIVRLPHASSQWRAAGVYEGSLRSIIHAFKYDGRESLAAPLAGLMRDAGADLLREADLVVPVPLHPWRWLRRGFNQADRLAGRLGVPVCRALWRTRATVPQAELDIERRRRNVGGAFRLSRFAAPSRVAGARIVLVDDVRTTGATLEACAGVLVDAGAESVRMLTAAQALAAS